MTYRKPSPEARCKYKDVVEKYRRGGCHNKVRANGFCHVHGGVEPGMTPAQIKLAKVLLEQAADEFSNHGCNDFNLLKDGGLTTDEAVEIQKWINTHPDFKNDPIDVNSKWAADWLLMRMLGEELLNGQPSGASRNPSPPGAVRPDDAVGQRLTRGCYQHYKGGTYVVLEEARHSETGETMVIYMGTNGQVWTRPKAMFTETVEVAPGDHRPRFRFTG